MIFVHGGLRHARDDLRRPALPRGRLRRRPARHDVPLRRRRAAAAPRLRVAGADRDPAPLPQRVRPAARARAVLPPRHPRADRAADAPRARRVPPAGCGSKGRPPGLRARLPPVRRRRLGRLRLPVDVLDPRLRADHRTDPHAAAGAPDVRGPQLRDLLVLPAQARLRRAGAADPVPPLEPELRGDDLLRRRELLVAEGDRGRVGDAAPVRHPARAAAGARRAVDRDDGDARAGGHVRHVPPAAAERRWRASSTTGGTPTRGTRAVAGGGARRTRIRPASPRTSSRVRLGVGRGSRRSAPRLRAPEETPERRDRAQTPRRAPTNRSQATRGRRRRAAPRLPGAGVRLRSSRRSASARSGRDPANLGHDGALHRVVGGREVRITPTGARAARPRTPSRSSCTCSARRSRSTPFYGVFARGRPGAGARSVGRLRGFRPPLVPRPVRGARHVDLRAAGVALRRRSRSAPASFEAHGERAVHRVGVPDARARRGARRGRPGRARLLAPQGRVRARPRALRTSTSTRSRRCPTTRCARRVVGPPRARPVDGRVVPRAAPRAADAPGPPATSPCRRRSTQFYAADVETDRRPLAAPVSRTSPRTYLLRRGRGTLRLTIRPAPRRRAGPRDLLGAGRRTSTSAAPPKFAETWEVSPTSPRDRASSCSRRTTRAQSGVSRTPAGRGRLSGASPSSTSAPAARHQGVLAALAPAVRVPRGHGGRRSHAPRHGTTPPRSRSGAARIEEVGSSTHDRLRRARRGGSGRATGRGPSARSTSRPTTGGRVRGRRRYRPRIGRPGRHRRSAEPRHGWVAVYDEVLRARPDACCSGSRGEEKLSVRDRLGRRRLHGRAGGRVGYSIFDHGSSVDDSSRCPRSAAPLPPGDLVGVRGESRAWSRGSRAPIRRPVRTVARTAASAGELPPVRELAASMARADGHRGRRPAATQRRASASDVTPIPHRVGCPG